LSVRVPALAMLEESGWRIPSVEIANSISVACLLAVLTEAVAWGVSGETLESAVFDTIDSAPFEVSISWTDDASPTEVTSLDDNAGDRLLRVDAEGIILLVSANGSAVEEIPLDKFDFANRLLVRLFCGSSVFMSLEGRRLVSSMDVG
jgi:hypothetical protein